MVLFILRRVYKKDWWRIALITFSLLLAMHWATGGDINRLMAVIFAFLAVVNEVNGLLCKIKQRIEKEFEE